MKRADKEIKCTIEPKDKELQVRYTPTANDEAGKYELTVNFNERGISGAPFYPVIEEYDKPDVWEVQGEGLSKAQFDQETSFEIVRRPGRKEQALDEKEFEFQLLRGDPSKSLEECMAEFNVIRNQSSDPQSVTVIYTAQNRLKSASSLSSKPDDASGHYFITISYSRKPVGDKKHYGPIQITRGQEPFDVEALGEGLSTATIGAPATFELKSH